MMLCAARSGSIRIAERLILNTHLPELVSLASHPTPRRDLLDPADCVAYLLTKNPPLKATHTGPVRNATMTVRGYQHRMIWRCVAIATLAVFVRLLSGCGSGMNGVNVPSTPSAPLAAVSNGPQLGYLWSASDDTLRPLLGVPGSSQFGQSVVTAGAYVYGAASARSSLALLESASGALSVMTVPQGSPQTIGGGTLKGATQIVFSPSGLNAVVYSAGATQALLLTGLSTTPQVQTVTASASVQAMAVSDNAQVATAYGSGPVTVALLTGNHASVASLSGFGGIAFLPGGSDLLMADSSTGLVTVVRNTATAPAAQSFTSTSIKTPFAVGGSADGLWAVVANSADQSVVRIDLTGATTPVRIACNCQPAQLTAMTGNAVFALTAPGSSPTWAVDASSTVPRTVFIPAMVTP
jgi:hypothetical protein